LGECFSFLLSPFNRWRVRATLREWRDSLLGNLHEWIDREIIKAGHGSLDDGHWPTATEGQRAAAIEHLGSRRLLIRFSQPDRAALIKEYDGQVKTPEDRRDDGTDNEIDGEAAIKLKRSKYRRNAGRGREEPLGLKNCKYSAKQLKLFSAILPAFHHPAFTNHRVMLKCFVL
jgi:hypothetical protein